MKMLYSYFNCTVWTCCYWFMMADTSSTSHSCEIKNCKNPAKFRCTSCQLVYYCSAEHQRSDWKANHKVKCQKRKKSLNPTPSISATTDPSPTAACGTSSESDKRTCRCMFCGKELLLSSEDEATDHMRVCVALQEQLASKDQFTIPTEVQQKMKKERTL